MPAGAGMILPAVLMTQPRAGGFSGGLIRSINSARIAGQALNVYVGGYGAGSSSTNTAGGGGGGSGVYLATSPGVVAGGGGGASYSNAATLLDLGGNCSTRTGADRCGLGGGGGAGALTIRAPSSTASCGGRGGDTWAVGGAPPSLDILPPIITLDCDSGGGDPSGRQGGGLVAGGGGGPSFMAGGSAYSGASAQRIGGGGAVGGEAGGYDDTNNTRGYGGGGGSGTADAGITNVSGEAGSYGRSFSDATRVGDKTNNEPEITGITPSLATANWQVGYSISGNGIPAGTTILSIDSNSQITMSQDATNGVDGITLTVTNSGSTVGGISDPFYSPSYLSTTLRNPGRAGTTGASGGSTSRDGRSGAVVFIW